jgi:hypothetical protein
MGKGSVALLAVLAGWAGAALAEGADDAAIRTVIESQLEAFNARDVNEAWTYASPMIQGMFGNPANFGMMVENGYPMVWTNSGAEFGELREVEGRLYQRVFVEDAGGGRHVLEYQMIETEAGWQINGVVVLPPEEPAV